MNEFDVFTLSVMSNRNHYDKYLKANTHTHTLADIFHKERAYYKERIIDLTKDLCGDTECSDNDVNESYQAYMKCCIRYLKWKDVTEMIQKEKYATATDAADAADDDDDDDDAVINARQELDKRIQDTQLPEPASAVATIEPTAVDADAIEPPRYNEKDKLISFANKMCIRKKTMDDFIIMKPSPTPVANLPQIRDYHDEIAKRTNDY